MTTTTTGGQFEMGRVVSRTFEVLAANFVPFFLLALLAVAPRAGLTWLSQTYVKDSEATGLVALPIALVAAMAGSLVQGAIMRGSYQTLSGSKAALPDMLSVGLRSTLPLFFLSICVGFMVGLASLALLVPGLMLATRWSVASPVQVIQKPGVFESMGRSADLTKGRRWPIFGLLIAYFLAVIVIELVLAALSGASLSAFTTTMNSGLYATVITPLMTAAILPIGAVGVTAIYYELRATREGFGEDSTAEVFS